MTSASRECSVTVNGMLMGLWGGEELTRECKCGKWRRIYDYVQAIQSHLLESLRTESNRPKISEGNDLSSPKKKDIVE